MMGTGATDFEELLREALTPIDPPADLTLRLESTLVNLTELAQDELEAWEISAMRDPRNWARPAAALVVGSAAGTALVLLRARRRAQSSRGGFPELSLRGIDRAAAERALRELGRETRRLLGERRARPP